MERLETRLEGADPGRARGPRRRPRLLPRELPARTSTPSSASPRSSCRTTTRAPSAGIVRGMHFQVGDGDGQARALRPRRDRRRGGGPAAAARRPSASGRRSSSTTRTCTSSTARSASRTASACTSDVADVMYKCSAYYDESIERGIAYDDPDVGDRVAADVELDALGARRERAAAARHRGRAAVRLQPRRASRSDGAPAPCSPSSASRQGRSGARPARPARGAGEHAVERAVGAAGRDRRLDRLDRHVDAGSLHDRQRELVPGAGAGRGQVKQRRSTSALDRVDQRLPPGRR